jgi:hypothetical protein
VERQDQVGARVVGERRRARRRRAGVDAPGQQRRTPTAVRRPSSRAARSSTIGGLLEAVAGGAAVATAVPGSTTTTLPGSAAPERCSASASRRTCGRPPVTLRPSWRSARSVAGPQVPSGTRPYSRCSPRRARSVRAPKTPSARPASKPSSSSAPAGRRRRRRRRGGSPATAAGRRAPAGRGERAVALRADDAVDGQPALLLELPERRSVASSKTSSGARAAGRADEGRLHVGDGRAAVAEAVELHGRASRSPGQGSGRSVVAGQGACRPPRGLWTAWISCGPLSDPGRAGAGPCGTGLRDERTDLEVGLQVAQDRGLRLGADDLLDDLAARRRRPSSGCS